MRITALETPRPTSEKSEYSGTSPFKGQVEREEVVKTTIAKKGCEGGRCDTCSVREERAQLGQMLLRGQFGGQRVGITNVETILSQNSFSEVIGCRKIKIEM